MLWLSQAEAEAWCRAQGTALDSRGRPKTPPDSVRFEIPSDAGERVALIARQIPAVLPEHDTLLWITEWGVWPSAECPHLFERLRSSYGETRPLIDIPATIFSPNEIEDLLSFVTLGVLFLWDLFVIGGNGGHVLFYSHDEFGWTPPL